MLSGRQLLTTLLVAKPDVVQRTLGKLLKRLVQEGFCIVGMRFEVMDIEKARIAMPQSAKQVSF